MKYVSTRGRAPVLGFADTLLTGLAPDGGRMSRGQGDSQFGRILHFEHGLDERRAQRGLVNALQLKLTARPGRRFAHKV